MPAKKSPRYLYVVVWRRAVSVDGVLLPRWGCRSPTASSVLSDSLWLGRQRRRILFALYLASAPPTGSSGGPWCSVPTRPEAPLAQDACYATCWNSGVHIFYHFFYGSPSWPTDILPKKKRGHILRNYVLGMDAILKKGCGSCLRNCCERKKTHLTFKQLDYPLTDNSRSVVQRLFAFLSPESFWKVSVLLASFRISNIMFQTNKSNCTFQMKQKGHWKK